MSAHRILIVDDEADIRKVVERSLARDPTFAIRCCASGEAALAEAADWLPHLILLDVMMPRMDGPTTLARLRADPATAEIPVVFLTARARSEELEHVAALHADGAIAKPFEPAALREAVRGHLGAAARVAERDAARFDTPTAEEVERFRQRLRADAATLKDMQAALRTDARTFKAREEFRTVVHKLAGASGLYGFDQVSVVAAALDRTIRDWRDDAGASAVARGLAALLGEIDRAAEPAGLVA
jgi:CheY-like chemotaxis protein